MGIRPSYIKSLATQLLNVNGDLFTGDFNANKALVTQMTNVKSKMIRNRLAGYITRKKNRRVIRTLQ